MIKYLLSTGKTTLDKVEYLEDLFRLHFSIHPKDIPGAGWIGVRINVSGFRKSDLIPTIKSEISTFLTKAAQRLNLQKAELGNLEIIDESLVKVSIIVGEKEISTSFTLPNK